MHAALTLVVLMSASDGAQELAVHDAAQAALGDEAQISVRVTSPMPDDAAAADVAGELHADALATVVWLDAAQRRASAALYLPAAQRWIHREIAFAEGDSAVEQGRTLGFAIASMLPESESKPASGSAPEGVPIAQGVLPPAPPAATAPLPPPVVPAAVATAAPPHRASGSLDASANAALAFGAEGDRFGGALGGQLDLGERFGLRMDLGASAGHIEAIEAHMFVFDLLPGVAWRSGDRMSERPLALEIRLSALARYLSVGLTGRTHETEARWVLGARMSLAGMWWFSREFALIASVGLDSTLGQTEIFSMGKQVASVEPFALAMSLGVRARL